MEKKNNLPLGWELCILLDLTKKINSGFASGKHNKNRNGVPHIRPMNIDFNGNINLSDVKYIENNIHDHLKKEDVLFNNTNSSKLLGKTARIKQDTNWAYSNHMTRIRFDTSLIESKWIAYYLHKLFWEGYYKIRAKNHVNQSSINSAFLSNQIPILLAPLNEQKRIVAKIEELFSLVDSIEQILIQTKNQLKFYYQSILKFYFDSDYEILKLNDVCDLLSGKAFKKSEYSTEGVRLFQIANVSFGKITWNDIAYLPFEYLKKYPELELKDGDVIMALNRPIIRRQIKVGMLSPYDVPSILYQRVGKFILSDYIIPKFLFYFLQSSMFVKQLESSLQGIDIPFINKSKLMSFSIPLPTLKEQKIIVQKIEEKFTLVQNTENSTKLLLLKIPLIKNTILKQAFEGKLVPQDPNDEHASELLKRIKLHN